MYVADFQVPQIIAILIILDLNLIKIDLNHFQNKQLKYEMWVAILKLTKCKGNGKCSLGKWKNYVMYVFFSFIKPDWT